MPRQPSAWYKIVKLCALIFAVCCPHDDIQAIQPSTYNGGAFCYEYGGNGYLFSFSAMPLVNDPTFPPSAMHVCSLLSKLRVVL